MAKKYEKVKLGLPAYITFAAFLVAIIVMVLVLLPSRKTTIRKMFAGTYTDTSQSQEGEEKSYDIGEKHVLKMCSFSSLKKQMKKDQYTYILYGDTSSYQFCLDAIEVNERAKEINEKSEGKKISIIYVNSKSLSDNQKEYLRDRLKKINPDVKSTDRMPSMDLWLVKNDEFLDCYSHESYQESQRSISYVAKYKIFSYTN